MLWRALVLAAVTAALVAGSYAFARDDGTTTTVIVDGPVWLEYWFDDGRLPESAWPGATAFAETGCRQCHLYLGSGSRNLGATALSAEGLRGRGVAGRVEPLRGPATPVHRERLG